MRDGLRRTLTRARYDSFDAAFFRVRFGGFPGSTVDERSSFTIDVANLRIP